MSILRRRSYLINGFIILILLALGVFLNFKYFALQPSYRHAWAQVDQFALSKGFLRNNFNLFQPQTYVINKQFPDNFEKAYDDAVTPSDLPLHQYVIAFFMKIFSSGSPFIFRFFIFLMSVLGSFYLFKLIFLFTKSYIKSLVVALFMSTSPVFVYYQAGFLPSVPCLSLMITGLYFYFKYSFSERNKDFILGILFLTLASLSRTSFVIPLFSVLGVELIFALRKRKLEILKWSVFFISIFLLLAQFLYKKYMIKIHGSMFLDTLMPADSLSDTVDRVGNILNTWKWQYFTKIHYILILVLMAIVVYGVLSKKINNSTNTLRLVLLMTWMFLGYFLFFIAMECQFENHDYYFIDSFFLPIILFTTFLFIKIPHIEFKYSGIVYAIIAILGISKAIADDVDSQNQIYSVQGSLELLEQKLSGSDKILDSLGISRDAKILYLDAQAPNIALNQLDRVGYIVMSTTREHYERAMQWKYDYIVFTNTSFIEKIYPVFPEIIHRVKKIYDNGNFIICKPFENKDQTIESFCNISGFSKSFEVFNDFEKQLDYHWNNINTTETKAFSGRKSQSVSNNLEFGIAYSDTSLHFLFEKNHSAIVSCQVYFENEIKNCNLVVSITKNDSTLFYKASDIYTLVFKPNEWHSVDIMLDIPKIPEKNSVFSVYLWNNGKNAFYIDDLNIRIY